MNLMARIVLGLLQFAVVVGLTGWLIDLTRTMRYEVVKVHKQGLVSLKQVNSALVGH